jgi:NADPH2:quinone reductase
MPSMKIVLCEQYGSHQDLKLREVPMPGPVEANEVQVAIAARGLSFSDLVKIAGNNQAASTLPFVVGGEGAGVVTKVGAGVNHLHPGDRVLAPSGCVEHLNIDASEVIKLKDTIDLQTAAAFRSNYATAYHGLQLARLQPGETLLVHGAAGGAGLAAVDMGKLLGARVIGAATGMEKQAVVSSLGADHVIAYASGFKEKVNDLTSGRGADVIFDPVGGDVFDESLGCIAPFGRLLVVGFTGGRPALAKTNHLRIKDASVIGFTLDGLQRHKPGLAAHQSTVLLEWLASGRIKPFVSHRLAMDDVIEAYQLIKDRQVAGKVILTSNQADV